MTRSEAFVLLATGLAIGYILGLASNDFKIPTEWVKDYQTLLTGVLAVAAAVVTLHALNEQIAEQRRQTALLLGNEDPIIDAVRYSDKDIGQVVAVRVVNLNRRTIVPREIQCTCDRAGVTVRPYPYILGEEKIRGSLIDALSSYNFLVPGWLDRSDKPSKAVFLIAVQPDARAIERKDTKATITTTAAFDVLETRTRRVVLEASTQVDLKDFAT